MADYLKILEVARRLDVSEPTVRRMVKSGKLPSVFVGGAYRVNEEDLEQYLENAKVKPEGDSPKAQAPRSVKEQLRDAPGAAVDLMESWASEGENTGIGPGSLFSTLFRLDVEIQRAEAEDRPGVIDDLAAEQDSETILRWLHIRRGWVEDGHYKPIHPMSAQAAARSLERLLKA